MAFPSCYVPSSDPLLRDGHGDGAHDTDEEDEEDATNVGQAELIHRGPRFFILKWTHQFSRYISPSAAIANIYEDLCSAWFHYVPSSSIQSS